MEVIMPEIKDIIVRKPTEEEKATCAKWPVWTCEPSEFEWQYTQTETCLLIEGEVTVTCKAAGNTFVSFKAGDLVILPFGLQCTWKITKAVKKYYDFE
jgi:uncharacterized cupin superfamily protein